MNIMHVYELKEFKKIVMTLRNALKKQGTQIRLEKKSDALIITYKTKIYYNFHTMLVLKFKDKSIEIANCTTYSLELDTFISSLAKITNVPFVQTITELDDFKSYDYIKFQYFNLNSNNYIEQGDLFDSVHTNILYKEIIPNSVKKYRDLLIALDSVIYKFTQTNKTTEFSLFNTRSYLDVYIPFYHMGFNGVLNISLRGNQFDIRLSKHVEGDFKREIELEKKFISLEELPETLNDMMTQCENRQKLVNLINPPKKHFLEFATENIPSSHLVSEEIYNFLIERIEPMELEVRIKDFKAQKLYYDSSRGYLIKVLDYFFTINFHYQKISNGTVSYSLNKVKGFEEKKDALEDFKRIINEHEEQIRLEKDRIIQDLFKKAKDM